MAQKFKKGDKVSWNSGQGEATGTIQQDITQDKTVDGQKISASQDDPRYLVENDNTGNVTGHKPDTLSKANSNGSRSSNSNSKSQKDSGSSSSRSDAFQAGDKVKWNTAQGETTGKVVTKLTSETDIEGHTAKASEDDPQYLVESESTGKQAAHKPGALTKV